MRKIHCTEIAIPKLFSQEETIRDFRKIANRRSLIINYENHSIVYAYFITVTAYVCLPFQNRVVHKCTNLQ